MTETEWLTATDPIPMLEYIRRQASERKLRLLGVACSRASWDRLTDDRSRRAVELAEQFADGLVEESTLEAVVQAAWDVRDELFDAGPAPAFSDDRLWLAEAAALTGSVRAWRAAFNRSSPFGYADYPFRISSLAHCHLLRDIFKPFDTQPVPFADAWITPDVHDLAQRIYADRAFHQMPILADALHDGGCEDIEILTHCRGDGPHVRGCWVVDRILGEF